jgi:hypothetical protein
VEADLRILSSQQAADQSDDKSPLGKTVTAGTGDGSWSIEGQVRKLSARRIGNDCGRLVQASPDAGIGVDAAYSAGADQDPWSSSHDITSECGYRAALPNFLYGGPCFNRRHGRKVDTDNPVRSETACSVRNAAGVFVGGRLLVPNIGPGWRAPSRISRID